MRVWREEAWEDAGLGGRVLVYVCTSPLILKYPAVIDFFMHAPEAPICQVGG